MMIAKWFLAMCAASLAFAGVQDVKIDSGRLKGAVSGSVVSWKGIPFAAPPVGENRWRPPQPVASWNDVRPATSYGADCMQKPFPGDAAPLGVTPAEDCLYLNIWRPVEQSGKLPVMVWFYGGGFVNGGSSPAVYDGSQFAENGVMLVSFNYRVGRFGFFAHPALTEAEGSGPLGNYAFMDQIAALQWVRKNIAAFGGDPDNVTIFGESAGGHSVLTLLTSPAAKGLFQKAIVESGGGRDLLGPVRRLHESRKGAPSAEEAGVAFAKKMGIEGTGAATLAALRALPAEKVVDNLNMMTMQTPTYAGPMIDGKIVTESVQDALLAGHQAKVPVIIGANSSEFGFSFARNMDELMGQFGPNRAKAEAIYDPNGTKDLRAVGSLIGSDKMFVEPARFVARKISASGQRAYVYRFSYVAESMRKEWKTGAPHATEIPFVFDTVAARYGEKLAPADRKISEAANSYWVAFAKTGEPNAAGRPNWPAFNATSEKLMNFTDAGPVAQTDPWKERLDLIEAAAAASQP
jgi:para-nitrobenzyl esterase